MGEDAADHVTNHTLKHECPDLYLDNHAMDIKFSPTCNILSVGQITGNVRIYAYTEKTMDLMHNFTHHTESVRSIDYNP